MNRSSYTPALCLALNVFLLLISFCNGKVYYVSESAINSDETGLSWENAFTSLNDALSVISSNNDEIWIARGRYFPNSSIRGSCFEIDLTYTVSIYGSFYGNETNINQRIITYDTLTVLDGDINERYNEYDNCYHILSLKSSKSPKNNNNNDNEFIFDGITFENGIADSNGDGFDSNQFGGVLYNEASNNDDIILTFKNCLFSYNRANEGGAIWSTGSNTVINIINCEFSHNIATNGMFKGGYGGAIFATLNQKIVINSTLFYNNTAVHRGGSIYGDYGSTIICDQCQFISNSATNGHGGAIFMEDRNSQSDGTYAIIENSIFESNIANYYGGAICWFNGVSPQIINTKFTSNEAYYGGAIVNFDDIYYDKYENNEFKYNIAKESEKYNDIYNDTLKTIKELSSTNETSKYNMVDLVQTLWDQKSVSSKFDEDQPQSAYICYVNILNCYELENCGDDLDGTTWDTAFYNIQDCFDKIKKDNPYTIYAPEIWVAKGTYKPSKAPLWALHNTKEFYSFIMYDGISMYGGFSGNEQNRTQRNWYSHPTYLSCFFGNDLYCSTILDSANDCIIDGFIFMDARYIDETDPSQRRRMKSTNGDSDSDTQTFSLTYNDVITANTPGRGGGVYANGTNVVIANSVFADMVVSKGGGVYCIGYTSSGNTKWPVIINSVFVNNIAERGGGIAGDAQCHFECDYCYFYNNECTEKGGGIYLDYGSNSLILNSVFGNNTAWESGGAIAIDGTSQPAIINTKMIDNGGFWEGGALYCGSHASSSYNGLIVIDETFEDNYAPFGNDDVWLWYNCYFTNIWNESKWIKNNNGFTTTESSNINTININNINNNKDETEGNGESSFMIAGLGIGVFIVVLSISLIVMALMVTLLMICCKRNKYSNYAQTSVSEEGNNPAKPKRISIPNIHETIGKAKRLSSKFSKNGKLGKHEKLPNLDDNEQGTPINKRNKNEMNDVGQGHIQKNVKLNNEDDSDFEDTDVSLEEDELDDTSPMHPYNNKKRESKSQSQ